MGRRTTFDSIIILPFFPYFSPRYSLYRLLLHFLIIIFLLIPKSLFLFFFCSSVFTPVPTSPFSHLSPSSPTFHLFFLDQLTFFLSNHSEDISKQSSINSHLSVMALSHSNITITISSLHDARKWVFPVCRTQSI